MGGTTCTIVVPLSKRGQRMSSEKRVRTPNEFNGMSLEQLQHKADVCHMMIDNAKREIKRH